MVGQRGGEIAIPCSVASEVEEFGLYGANGYTGALTAPSNRTWLGIFVSSVQKIS